MIRAAAAALFAGGCVFAALTPLGAGFRPVGHQGVATYKSTPQGGLKIHLYFPPGWKAADHRPGMVLFFGGGCATGNAAQFASTAEYFAGRGLVAASAEYRIESIHHTPPQACAEDGKSAIRWLRLNASRLGIDPGRVIAGGGSSGATMAAFAAYNSAFEPDDDEQSISFKPDALLLVNPAFGYALNNLLTPEQAQAAAGPLGAFFANWKVTPGGPPAILFFGTEDVLKEKALDFARELAAAGTRAEFYTAEGQKHGFYNRAGNSPWHLAVLRQMDLFLVSLGYLHGSPPVESPGGHAVGLRRAPI